MLSVQFKVDNVSFLFIHIAKVGKMLLIFNNGSKKFCISLLILNISTIFVPLNDGGGMENIAK